MRGKGEGSLYKRASDGLWVATVELPPGPDGKRRKKTVTSKQKAVVMKRLADMRRELERAGDLPTASQTLESWLTYWLTNVAQRRVRPTVLPKYESIIRVHILPVLGRTPLDKLTPAHVVRLRNAMTDKGLSSTYALGAHRVLSKALEDAMREGRVGRNVAKLTDAPRRARTDLHALTVPEAIEVVRTALVAFDAPVYDPTPARWAAYLVTGLRKGELIGLEWDRVGDVIDLSWQLQRLSPESLANAPADYEARHLHEGLYLTRPKTQAGRRIIPLPPELRPIFDRHRERATPNKHGLVFTTPTGKPIDPAWENRLWNATAPRFTDKHVRVHDLRHTTADLLYEAGLPEDIIIDILGHSTWAMSRSYRSKGATPRHIEGMQRLSRLLELN